MQNPRKTGKVALRFSLLIFLVCLLFTFLIWDHYYDSDSPLDRELTSKLHLLMGTLFSIAAGLFAWSLENARNRLEDEVARRTEELEKRNEALKQAIGEVRILRGFLPICACCKKIRNDKGYWEEIEDYIQSHSEAAFSHGLCKDCITKMYPGQVAQHPPEGPGHN